MVPVVEEEDEVLQEVVAAEVHLVIHLEVEALAEEAAALEATIQDSKIETAKVVTIMMKSQKNLKNQIITTVEV